MSDRFNARLHHRLGLIHDTVEAAFLNAGMLLSTLALLMFVFLTLWVFGR